MIIYFVRHGHPDYKTDSLTEIGHRQAQAAAERLAECGIQTIFASPQGRAQQTAQHTAQRLGQEIHTLDFMHEVSWKRLDQDPTIPAQSPWAFAANCIANGQDFPGSDWQTDPAFAQTKLPQRYINTVTGIDAWLDTMGYCREGNYYRVHGSNTNQTVAIFSHGGSSSAALSHMLNIPFFQFCATVEISFTSITKIYLSDEVGAIVSPQIHLLNDAGHIVGISTENNLRDPAKSN